MSEEIKDLLRMRQQQWRAIEMLDRDLEKALTKAQSIRDNQARHFATLRNLNEKIRESS